MKYKFLIFLFAISTAYGKVYDCFLFFNELEILEIRLNELYDVVDKFVILEASQTFTGLEKPYYFELNKERFERFSEKIIHIKLDKKIQTKDAWARERFQRNSLIFPLTDCDPDDIIIISDVDEILSVKMAELLPSLLKEYNYVGFSQKYYRYFLNRETKDFWPGICATTFGYMLQENIPPENLRNMVLQRHTREQNNPPIFPGGWHFSSMGGYERFLEKKKSYSHHNDAPTPTYEQWRIQVDQGVLVPIDNTFPLFVQENLDYLINAGFVDEKI